MNLDIEGILNVFIGSQVVYVFKKEILQFHLLIAHKCKYKEYTLIFF